MTPEPERAVLLGGSFDPVHNGHLVLAEEARRALDAPVAWLVPAREPPLRPPPAASGADRLALVAAAVRGHPHLDVLDLELRRDGPSYTVDTLAQVEEDHPGTEVWIVLGADAARHIGAWHRARDLLARGRFALVDRAGAPPLTHAEVARLGFPEGRTRLLDARPPDVSATEIRRRVRAGESVATMVPEVVARLIVRRGMYRGPGVHNGCG